MPEFTYPGLYQEERGRRLAPIQGVSTSNFGVVGMAERGPTDEATLCTSFAQFQEQFGNFITDSVLATQIYAFFANDGQRSYVVRVTRSDAVKSTGYIENDVTREHVATGDEVVLGLSSIPAVGPDPVMERVPVKPFSVSIEYDIDGIPVVGEVLYTAPAAPPPIPTLFAWRLASYPISRPVAATLFLSWTVGGLPITAKITGLATADILEIKETVGGAVIGFVDCETGYVVADFTAFPIDPSTAAPPFVSTVTAGYIPMDRKAVVDDGAGLLTGDVGTGPNQIDYDGSQAWSTNVAGVYEFTTLASPISRGSKCRFSYTQYNADLEMKYKGAYGNDVTVRVKGSEGSYDRERGLFSAFDLMTLYDDPIEGGVVTKENFTGIVFDVPTDANYLQTVINDAFRGSDWWKVLSQTDDLPGGLNSSVVTRDIIGGGDGSKLAFVGTVRWGAITPYTLRINVTIGGTAYPIDDDGASGMTDGGAGVLDPAGTNSVDYATGIINLTFAAGSAPDALTFLSSNYCQDATRGTSQDEDMAGGTDGVVPLSRAQVSHPTLEATNKGMYALNVPDEMMQVGVPDFAGDTTLAGDQLDWAGRVKDKFIILATPYGMTPTQAKDYKRFTLNRNDTYGALYYPWVGLTDPVTNSQVFQPPIGHLAGVMARTDNNRTVSKAPAGVEDGKLAFTTSLEYKMSLVEIGVLNPIGVNCLFESEFTGRCVWGARTLGVNTDFRYIQARRFFIFNEKSVYRSMWGFVFETVGGMLFDRIQTAIEGFESGLLALGGYFPSGNPGLSYRVICDTSNNTDATLALGIVICDIYLATTVPGEFIWFRYQQLVTTA